MSILVHYDGRIVATVGARRVYLAPDVATLPDGDPVLRFVSVMCAYALEVARGTLPGPYEGGRAGAYAREVLIDRDRFAELGDLTNDAIARHFAVPAAEIADRRAELA